MQKLLLVVVAVTMATVGLNAQRIRTIDKDGQLFPSFNFDIHWATGLSLA